MNEIIKEKFKQAIAENTESKSDEFSRLPKSVFIIPGIVFITIIAATYFFNPYSNLGPIGKIEMRIAGSKTGKEVKVVGETRNITEGQFVWLAVDKPGIGLCWPKKLIAANAKFSTTILEEGPKEEFTLSLYMLDENFHKQWKEWQDHKIFGGLHLPPETKRLKSVRLILKG